MNQFAIPAFNSTIEFSGTISYLNTSFENNTWYFSNLILNGITNSTLLRFSVSAQNCNVTITSFLVSLYADVGVGFDSTLNYNVAGTGNQTFNFSSGRYSSLNTEQVIVIDGAVRNNGEGWTSSKDGTITVTNSSSFVSIQSSFPLNLGPVPGNQTVLEFLVLVAVVTLLGVALGIRTLRKRLFHRSIKTMFECVGIKI